MLSIGRISAGADVFGYLTTASVADYYAEDAQVVGRWIGTGAAELHLDGPVDQCDLQAILAGVDPVTGDPLGELAGRQRAGFDLTFSAPKGVSLLAALGGPDLAAEIASAHRRAVADALGYLERRAVFARRGHGGITSLPTSGLIGAAFEHHTSRALDPQLHTHVIVANSVRAEDGRYSAIFGRTLYRHAKTAGALYQSALRAELTRRIGLEWQTPHRGLAEPAGIAPEVLAEFSRRRAAIQAELDDRGAASTGAARTATLVTRPDKPQGVDRRALRAEWMERADAHGLQPNDLLRLTGSGRDPHPTDEVWDDETVRLLGPDGLTSHATTFDRRMVLLALADQAVDGADIAVLEQAVDRLLAAPDAIGLDPADRVGGDDAHRFTTAELLAVERHVVANALARVDARVGVASDDALTTALATRPELADEQRDVVRALVRSGQGVHCVVGPAGTGKTFALDAARDAWQQSGVPVIGTAVAGRAAAELASGTAIPSTTIFKLLDDIERPGAGGLRPGTVLVVDEAAMVGTRDLARLAGHIADCDGKLVLVGDPRQLPEIAAGGAFTAIANRVGVDQLTVNRRQVESWERAALAELRTGSVRTAILAYDHHDRIVLTRTAPDARAAMVDAWARAHTAGDDAVMFASRRVDVADLNLRARAALAAGGHLGPDDLLVDGQRFAVGDRVLATRNQPRLDLFNGTRATVTGIADGQITLRLSEGGEHDLSADELGRARLTYGYAMTAHKGQGATVDRAFLLGGDSIYREVGYTGMSRARLGTDLFVVEPAPSREEAHVAERSGARSALDELIGDLSRSSAQRLALESAPVAPPPGADLGRLERERDRLAHLIAQDRPEVIRRDLAAGPAAASRPDAAQQRRAETRERLTDRQRAAELAIRDREDLLGRAALAVPPAYLVAELGPPALDDARRAEWARAARTVECYRDRWGESDPALAIGTRPVEKDRQPDWDRADRVLRRAQRELGIEDTRALERDRTKNLGLGWDR